MTIISEKVEGTVINVDITSSNLESASYDTESKILSITFNNGSIYEYYDFPWEKFIKFRMTESQGKFFRAEINGKYKFKKVTS